MGGDGGVIASNRKYMRGAGTANHTADRNSSSNSNNNTHIGEGEKKHSIRKGQEELMTTCYLTKLPLEFGTGQESEGTTSGGGKAIVADPYGRLYYKEAVIEALLLRRKTATKTADSVVHVKTNHPTGLAPQVSMDPLGSHIRGLKDLYPVRVQVLNKKPVCPVTLVELNGWNVAYLILNSNNDHDGPNVLSERAMTEMGKETLQQEYGNLDHDNLLRLAPPPDLLNTIQEQVRSKQEQEKGLKKKRTISTATTTSTTSTPSKALKRQKKNVTTTTTNNTTTAGSTTTPTMDVTAQPQSQPQRQPQKQRVQSAVIQSNEVFSSLFTNNKDKKKISNKERAANLFTLNT